MSVFLDAKNYFRCALLVNHSFGEINLQKQCYTGHLFWSNQITKALLHRKYLQNIFNHQNNFTNKCENVMI